MSVINNRYDLSCPLDGKECFHGGLCLAPTSTCQCSPEFSGEFCEEIITCTEEVQCLNEAECDPANDERPCICPSGFSGYTCAISG